MTEKFQHCASQTQLTDAQVEKLKAIEEARRIIPGEGTDVFEAHWCDLIGKHNVHFSEVLAPFEDTPWWVRWEDGKTSELVQLPHCPVDSLPYDAVDTEPCLLFADHPGQHDWETRDPSTCAHADARAAKAISEAVSFDGRYVTVIEGSCEGCAQQVVLVRVLDPSHAKPPQHLGARTAGWAVYGPES